MNLKNCLKILWNVGLDTIQHWNETRWVLNSKTNTETQEQQNSNSWTPLGPTKDRKSSPNQLDWKLLGRSEARPTSVQLKGAANLLTVIGLSTKHAICRITFMLYSVLL